MSEVDLRFQLPVVCHYVAQIHKGIDKLNYIIGELLRGWVQSVANMHQL